MRQTESYGDTSILQTRFYFGLEDYYNDKKKKQESGRSMVEMLGVLAIISVLSIGGIAGYTLSMRRHRANQVLDIATKYSVIAYTACQEEIIDKNISTLLNCKTSSVPPITDTDLELPGDASSIFFNSVTESDGVQTILISIYFKDNNIYKATKAITGEKKS